MRSVTVAGLTLSGTRARLVLTASRERRLTLLNGGRRSAIIPVEVDRVWVEGHLVNLGRRPNIRVVEHLFSALYGMNFFGIRIDLFHDELPFFDGSSQAYASALARLRPAYPAPRIRPDRIIRVRRGRSFLEYRPGPADRLVVDLTLRHAYLGIQRRVMTVTPRTFVREIAPARTFVFTGERDPRLKRLPPYGFALTRHGYRSASPPRFPDEAVRHKILDLLGDLYVLGGRLCGTVIGCNTSHVLNHMLVRKITEK